MTWRIHQQSWPNGRKFWTVEDRQNNQARVGSGGGISKFYDRTQAKTEADRLNEKPAKADESLIERL